MKKIFKNSLFTFILGAVLFTGIGVYAAKKIFATEVSYTSSKTTKTNVSDALTELYEKANSCGKSNAAAPELYEGLIPIMISNTGAITYADTKKEWYNYDDKMWANAVILSNPSNYKVGDTINENDILMYFVWVPRYRYQLFNVDNGSIDPFSINIEFENKTTKKSTGTKNGEWLTHPAFTFGTTELNGIWVGKFETTGTKTDPTIKPGVKILFNVDVSTAFNIARSIELNSNYHLNKDKADTHMMKNMEWGAMAYLSHSKYGTCTSSIGACNEITNNSSSYTGGSSSKTSWAQLSYIVQSTTRNRYGIYDTVGGGWEYVMGNMTSSTTSATSQAFNIASSGFTSAPEDKYIDYYTKGSSLEHNNGRIGDATRETLKTFGNAAGSWYDGKATYGNYWFKRGGCYSAKHGIFSFYAVGGEAYSLNSFRIVLTAD